METLSFALQYLLLEYSETFALCAGVGTFATLSALLRRESAR